MALTSREFNRTWRRGLMVEPETGIQRVAGERYVKLPNPRYLKEIEGAALRLKRSQGTTEGDRSALYRLLILARNDGHTLETLGRAAGVTAARVQQITTGWILTKEPASKEAKG